MRRLFKQGTLLEGYNMNPILIFLSHKYTASVIARFHDFYGPSGGEMLLYDFMFTYPSRHGNHPLKNI